MARHQEDREDILREATALVERVELEIENLEDPVVVGFRRDSGPAFFFGADFAGGKIWSAISRATFA